MIKAALLCMILLAGPAFGAPSIRDADLYQSTAYVTGTRPDTRAVGIVTSFRRVLVKVSGNPSLANDPRLAAIEPQAAGMVEDLAYQDRMSDEPHHDEQGTRDRPFDLTVHFDPAKIDAVLAQLGEHPWSGPRPRLLVRISINDHGDIFPLSADAEADERQREAILAAGDRYGMRVVLPPTEGAAPMLPDNPVILSGTLVWDDNAFGWVGTWHLESAGALKDWRIEGVSFDDAFRDALAGSMTALSGH